MKTPLSHAIGGLIASALPPAPLYAQGPPSREPYIPISDPGMPDLGQGSLRRPAGGRDGATTGVRESIAASQGHRTRLASA